MLIPADSALDDALRAADEAGLPQISVTPNQGKLLYFFARLRAAKNILEIGTLGGYSTIWLARALPTGGRLITLESELKHAEVARVNLSRAELSGVVELRHGPAAETLAQLVAEETDPFDLIFIDADKPSYPIYLEWSLKLSRPGSLIIADNIVRNGAVVDSNSPDPKVQGVRQFNDLVAAESRLSATALQTVGSKGYDGF